MKHRAQLRQLYIRLTQPSLQAARLLWLVPWIDDVFVVDEISVLAKFSIWSRSQRIIQKGGKAGNFTCFQRYSPTDCCKSRAMADIEAVKILCSWGFGNLVKVFLGKWSIHFFVNMRGGFSKLQMDGKLCEFCLFPQPQKTTLNLMISRRYQNKESVNLFLMKMLPSFWTKGRLFLDH